jgi:hypothetical protein
MARWARTTGRRAAGAYDTLSGRTPKPDYGILIIFPFLAAAGGSLAALAVEMVIEGRKSRRARARLRR